MPYTTTTFTHTGADQSFVVPAGVTSLTVSMWGGGGGGAKTSSGSWPSANGGGAGATFGTLAVTPGETLTIIVGGRGRNNGTWISNPATYGGGGLGWGGGNQCGGSGGGRSAIRRGGTEVATAGGGGGGGSASNTKGGSAGGDVGFSVVGGGGGGTQTAGGAATGNGTAGSAQTGGAGGGIDGSGGGGGGGYFGGGGGAGSGSSGHGGGGGSGYLGLLTVGATISGTAGSTTPAASVHSLRGSAGAGGSREVDNATDGVVVLGYGPDSALLTPPNPIVVAGVVPRILSAAINAPAGTFTGYFGGGGQVTAPMQTAVAYGPASVSAAAPSPEFFAAGHDAAGEQAAYLTAPLQTLSAFGGATASLTGPKQTLSITGTFTNFGAAALTAPGPTLSAAGRTSGVGTAALQAPMGRAVGYSGAVLSVTVGSATLTATGTSGSVGRATLTAPLFELTASATRQNSGSAILTAPVGRLVPTGAAWLVAPGAQLTAIGTAVVAVTYEAYALNLKHANPDSVDELTHYTNYPFDKIVRYQNSYFGVNATGLYLLEGPTDFAEPTPQKVAWSFKTCMTDFKTPNLKTVNWAYFGGRMAPAATVSIHFGDTGEQSYAYATPRGASAQNYRQPFGRGIKSRYYALEAEGDGELSLDSLMFDIAKSARKV